MSEPWTVHAEAVEVNWSPELEALHEEVTRDHFIDVCTRRALLDGIAGAVPRGGTLVEVGCSTGYLLEDLAAEHSGVRLVGVDLVAEGLAKAHANVPSAELMLADVTALPFADGEVDALVSANVLEHVAADNAALAEIRRVLRPGGVAVIVVPTGTRLYDYYDRFLGHERRYGRGELAAKARAAGMDIARDGFLGSVIYPAFWLTKKRNRRRHAADLPLDGLESLVRSDIGRTRDSRLGALTTHVERRLLRHGISLPFGVRGVTVVRRP